MGEFVHFFNFSFLLTKVLKLTMSGLALIGVTSLIGMLKKEVSFLSWLIVIWERVVKANDLMK